jgi:hypothetical protein
MDSSFAVLDLCQESNSYEVNVDTSEYRELNMKWEQHSGVLSLTYRIKLFLPLNIISWKTKSSLCK